MKTTKCKCGCGMIKTEYSNKTSGSAVASNDVVSCPNITDEMIQRAITKAIEVEMISNYATFDHVSKTIIGMRKVLKAALGS